MQKAVQLIIATVIAFLLVLCVLGAVKAYEIYDSRTTPDAKVQSICDGMKTLNSTCWCYWEFMRECPWEGSLE